MLTRTIF